MRRVAGEQDTDKKCHRHFPGSFIYVKLAPDEVLPEAETECPPEGEDDEDEREMASKEGTSAEDKKIEIGDRIEDDE